MKRTQFPLCSNQSGLGGEVMGQPAKGTSKDVQFFLRNGDKDTDEVDDVPRKMTKPVSRVTLKEKR